MEVRTKTIDELKVSDYNVRKNVDREEFERLKASILAVYQKYNRLVRPLGITEEDTVIMGSLRLLALQELMDEKKIPKTIKIPCTLEKDLDDKTQELFSLIENISPVPLEHQDRVEAVKHLIKKYGDIVKVSRLLGVSPQTVGRWIALEKEAPLLARLGQKEGVGERKIEFIKQIIDERPELKPKQNSVVKAASQIARPRLESMAAEAKAGYTVEPSTEAKLAKTRRLQTLYIREDIYKFLGMYSGNINQTISEILEEMIKGYQPLVDFLKSKGITIV